MAKPLDIFLVYQFLRRLATPFEKWDAYKLGIIDKSGSVIKERSSLSSTEKKAFGHFDVLVMNLKKLLEKVPGGKAKVASYAAALLLLREHNATHKELVYNETLLERELVNEIRLVKEQGMPKGFKELMEEAPVNAVGGGNIAGTDENPPVHMKKKKKNMTFMRRTSKPYVAETFNGSAVFEVDTDTFMKCRLSKRKHDRYEQYIGECEGGEDIRQYGLDNPGKPIMVKDRQTGAMLYLRYGGKYPKDG